MTDDLFIEQYLNDLLDERPSQTDVSGIDVGVCSSCGYIQSKLPQAGDFCAKCQGVFRNKVGSA